MRSINRLSARRVETVKEAGRHADGQNLYLSVSASGARSWIFLFRWKGKPTEMGLGSARDVSLLRARELASSARQHLLAGRNPLEHRRADVAVEAAAPTFGAFADDYIASQVTEANFKNAKHRAQWAMTLRVYAAPLRPLLLNQITTDDVYSALLPIWEAKPETARRTQGRIERVLDAAKVRNLREGDNPARWKFHLDRLLKTRPKDSRGHHAAIAYKEVPSLIQKLGNTSATSALALTFLILTASRTGEVLGAEWKEIDFENCIWSVPASRMKAKKPHRVPLTPRLIELLKAAQKLPSLHNDGRIFPGRKEGVGLSNTSLKKALDSRVETHATLHGFRSAFRDWVGDETMFAREVAEAALAHAVGDAAEQAYRRGDALKKRREMMLAWDHFCFGDSEPAAPKPRKRKMGVSVS